MIEREVKIRVSDLAALRPRLEAMGATRTGEEHEINHILDTADGSLQRRSEVLRVRRAGKSTFTWKGIAADQDPYGHKAREELEVEIVADGAETLLAILGKLGYNEVIRYTKHRETWRWQSVEIALDRLDFGNFIEIEGEAAIIQDALHRLQLDGEPIEQRSYPELQRVMQLERERAQ
ncbi:MAG: putative adenylate cyclase [Chloroflexi bacterium]|nr:putative adenylate cyclase [Chloroflexota bacterium]MDB5057373.1 putative adenylate cyclase [Chloroflexota bacterium]